MWLSDKKNASVDASLAEFIISLADLKPCSRSILLVDGKLLGELVRSPSSELRQAWRALVWDKFRLISAGNGLKSDPVVQITPALIGLAVILNNRAALKGEAGLSFNRRELVDRYDRDLLNHLPRPREVFEIIAFDLVVGAYTQFLRDEGPVSLDLLETELLEFSPFSSLKTVDLVLPRPLAQLAFAYLPHWSVEDSGSDRFADWSWWWESVAKILEHPGLSAELKNSWLELPESRLSCLGLGLFFEEIRRRGQSDDLILGFFEAGEFLQKVAGERSSGVVEPVQLSELIKDLLSAPGDSLSGRRLNQIGNEYFMKFRALLEIVAARGGVPGEFRHLSYGRTLKRLLPLVSLASITGGERLRKLSSEKFSEVRFSG